MRGRQTKQPNIRSKILTATESAEHENERAAQGRPSQEHGRREPWAPSSVGDAGAIPLPDAETFSEYQALPEEPPRAIYEGAALPETPVHPAGPHELSDEEVSSLAEQLAEARHEEVSAKADADAELGMLEEEDFRMDPKAPRKPTSLSRRPNQRNMRNR